MRCPRCYLEPDECECTGADMRNLLATGQKLMTYGQPEPKTLARAGHPDTSHEAALKATRDGTVQRSAKLALDLVELHPGWTAGEYAAEVGGHDSRAVGRRLPELADQGLIRRGEKRACRISGHNATTWWPVLPKV